MDENGIRFPARTSAAADVADGSEAQLAWSDLLDLLVAGASVFFSAAVRLRAAAGCGVE